MSAPAELLSRIGGHRRWIAASTALGLVTTMAGVALIGTATALLTRSAFDTGASMSLAILAVRASAVVRVVSRYVDRYVGHLGTFRILTRLRSHVFASLARADSRLVVDRDRGAMVTSLVDDVETMQEHLLRVTVPPLVAIGTLTATLVALAMIDGRAAIASIAILAIIALIAPMLLRRSSDATQREAISLRSDRNDALTSGFGGLDELAVWGRTDLITTPLDVLADAESTIVRRTAALEADGGAVATITIATAALVGIALLSSADIATDHRWWIAALPLMTIAAAEVLGPLFAAGRTASRTDAAARRLLELDDAADLADAGGSSAPAPTVVPTSTPIADGLTLDRVSFRHPAGPTILDAASLRLPSSTTAWISAPSGVGKSSVVALLCGLTPCDSGTIALDGIDIGSIDVSPTTRVAAVLTPDHLFDTTIRDDLLVADRDAVDDALLAACSTAGLDEFLLGRSSGLDAPTGPDGAAISGGERQRLLLARALLAEAPVLVLDEPIEHLDRRRGVAILGAVLASRRDRITIVFAHDGPPEDLAQLVDLDLRLDAGRIVPVPTSGMIGEQLEG